MADEIHTQVRGVEVPAPDDTQSEQKVAASSKTTPAKPKNSNNKNP